MIMSLHRNDVLGMLRCSAFDLSYVGKIIFLNYKKRNQMTSELEVNLRGFLLCRLSTLQIHAGLRTLMTSVVIKIFRGPSIIPVFSECSFKGYVTQQLITAEALDLQQVIKRETSSCWLISRFTPTRQVNVRQVG